MSQTDVEDEIDLRALFAVLLTYWKLILLMLFLGLAIGIFYAKTATPVYRSNALIQVDKKSPGISALGADVSNLLQMEASPADTEIELIKSRMTLLPVINSLHLDLQLAPVQRNWIEKLPYVKNNTVLHNENGVSIAEDKVAVAYFNVPQAYYGKAFILSAIDSQHFALNLADSNVLKGTINIPISLNTHLGRIDIRVNSLPTNQSYYLTKQAPSQAVDTLLASMSVAEQGKLTGILSATLEGVNQEQTTHILTKIVQTYEQQNQDKSSAETNKTLAFMQEQLPQLKARLNATEAAFNQFREQNGTVDIDKEAELAITQSGEIQKSLRELELKRAELSERYTDEYPVLQQLNAQIAELERKESGLESRLVKIPEIQRRFVELSSDAKISNEIYLTMLKNYQQLQIVKSGQIGYVRIVDLPISTYLPIAPKKAQVVALATLLGLILGIGLALLRGLFNSGVRNPDALEIQTGVPVVGVIPHWERLAKLSRGRNRKLPLLEQLESEGITNEGIKSLRTHLLFNATANKCQRLMITSASPSMGKSFLSANLAVAMAMADKKVLLIDADARRGHLHQYFNLLNGYGLTDYIASRESSEQLLPNELIQMTIHPNLEVITRGSIHHNASELLLNGQLKQLLEQMSIYYDYIIIDTPPVMATSDALTIGQLVDTALFIARYNISIVKQVDFAITKLSNANVPVKGIVLNDTRQSKADSYNYHYSYDYRSKKS